MNNKEYRSPEELAMQKALDGIREEFPDFWKDLEEFDEEPETPKPETADPVIEATRRRKFRRRLIAACFIGVCILSTAMTIFINSDAAHAMKFAMEKKYYQAKGWVQATDDDAVNDNNSLTIIETDGGKVDQYKKLWNELKKPSYMSSGYVFKELCIEKNVSGTIMATYEYEKEKNSIIIILRNKKEETNTQLYLNTIDLLEGKCNYKVWMDESVGTKGIEVITNELIISVFGYVEDDELKRIINGLQ